MKTILLTIAFLMSFPVFAQTASKIPSLQLGTRTVTDNPADLKMLHCSMSANNSSGCRDLSDFTATTGYVVPGGKTFVLKGFYVEEVSNSVCGFSMGYTTGAIDQNAASVPATITYLGNNNPNMFHLLANESQTFALPDVIIPAGGYPFVTLVSGACDMNLHLWGKEI